jgi:hypothetical protein
MSKGSESKSPRLVFLSGENPGRGAQPSTLDTFGVRPSELCAPLSFTLRLSQPIFLQTLE